MNIDEKVSPPKESIPKSKLAATPLCLTTFASLDNNTRKFDKAISSRSTKFLLSQGRDTPISNRQVKILTADNRNFNKIPLMTHQRSIHNFVNTLVNQKIPIHKQNQKIDTDRASPKLLDRNFM